ncbi:damage-inducible protein DinB [Paenibacillus sp. H1-7]|uniref:DinB family protein n=1 Tax=Paenibacillus sp. H1-7 TaxID=2282849 RepID=UPI001EF7A9EE|nr:DinB family protein [Paenibacillus sp. H1-7]ULL17038.1 damage-inducible protein DinB [Paenibacillus sp. H1-7]
MYTSVKGFLEDWKIEASLTLQVLDKLTDASLKQTVSDAQQRSLGEIAWHLVGSFGAFLHAAGLQLEVPDFKEQPTSAEAIAAAYRRVNDAAATALTEQWSDAKLQESLRLFNFIDTTYGGVLSFVLRHQIHHRGQMTILMRQAGLVAPGVYGPNEEETIAMRAARAQQ